MINVAAERKTYPLKELLSGFVDVETVPEGVELSGLCLNSRQLEKNDVFIALMGTQLDGGQFVHEAIQKGAVAILHESPANDFILQDAELQRIPLIHIPQLRKLTGEIASRFYGTPSHYMKIVGVTGTDGKTSVSHFIAQALSLSGHGCGVIGTLGNGIYGALSESTHTTPDAIQVHRLLAKFLPVDHVSMEVSSHALDQERVAGVKFDTAVFTNLSRDHLDYHGSMESYWNAKRRLFFKKDLRCAIININDKTGRQFFSELQTNVHKVAYGYETPIPENCTDWVIGHKLELSQDGFGLSIETPENLSRINCHLLGRFNALNVLAAIATLRVLGISTAVALNAISRLTGVAGRMEFFRSTKKPDIVIDYAHTPEALRTVLNALREHTTGKVWCVFGCGGDRDKGKRSMMGEVAEQLADHVILTNDNPRSEDPKKIIANIMQGIHGHENVCSILDREEAIRFAVDSASLKDKVLVAGKGHETYQVIGDKKVPYSDKTVVTCLLQEKS